MKPNLGDIVFHFRSGYIGRVCALNRKLNLLAIYLHDEERRQAIVVRSTDWIKVPRPYGFTDAN